MKKKEKITEIVRIFSFLADTSVFWSNIYGIPCIVCRQLQCDRVTLHKNLFVSYILNGMAWILYYTLAALDGNVLSRNPVSFS